MSSPPTEEKPLDAPRILLVDDHADARVALSRLLSMMGYAVVDVENGARAFDLLSNEPPPDLLLTDLRLPDYDGREVIQAARRLEPVPRIALMTGWDVEPDECQRLGIDWVFPKPVDFRLLLDSLEAAGLRPAGNA